MLQFDHIAFTAPSRTSGKAAFAEATGVDMPDGGEHPAMGTHNALTALGPDSFVEVIAVNPDAPAPARARWFDLDARSDHPALGTPILLYRTDDLEADLGRATHLGFDIGGPLALSRDTLTWNFAVRQDGSLPEDGAPILLQWTHGGVHPAGGMADQGLRLASIAIATPKPDQLSELFAGASICPEITAGHTPQCRVTLTCPDGREVTF